MSRSSQYFKVIKWLIEGKPVPPPHLIKQKMLLTNAKLHNTNIMVETGTLMGDMVDAMKGHFSQIYSIEISPEFARKAQQRFKGNNKIQIIEADSGVALKSLVPQIQEAAIFWLDGHYSGGETGKGDKDTPILDELASIYASKYKHIVLIDDARCFGTEKDYPSIDELTSYIKSLNPSVSVTITNDCIVITQ